MEYNATLKREIPAGWNDSILGKFIELDRGVTYSKEDVRTQDDKDTIGILRATNVTGNNVDIDDLVFIPSSRVNVNQMLNKFDILIVMSSGSKEHVGKNGVYYFEKTCIWRILFKNYTRQKIQIFYKYIPAIEMV